MVVKVKVYFVEGGLEKVKDLFFGFVMGEVL